MALQLPSTLQNTQVRSLGQASPSEPVQAANAEASAALAWGNAFNAAGAATNKILGDLADSRRDQKVSRSVLEDKMGYAQFEAELNKNVYTPGVDPELDNAADVWKKEQADWDESMPIPMAEIANAAWVAKTKSLTAARLELMDEKEGAAYINNMTPTVYNGTQRLANSTIVRQLESVKAEQDAQYLRYASQGNEQDALQVLKEGFTTGVYTFKEYREKEMMLGSVIDTSNIRNMLDTAQDPADVEEAEDALANSRVLPEQKSALYKRVDAGKEEQYKFRTRRQDANYTEGQNMSVGGTLTRAYITDTDMTGGQKSALLSQLTSKQTVMSNKNVASDLAGQIREIKYIEDSPYASVSEKSEALREQLRVATYGLRDQSTGRYLIEPSISGEDYAKLDGDLNKAQTEWAHSNPYYKQSIEQLKKITGYSDMFSSISGNAPNFEAYRDGKLAMDSYMDTMGAEADPRDWLKDYGKMFDYKTYAKQGVGDYVGKSFPEYSEFKDKEGNFDRDLIIADAYFRREKGELEGWQVEQLVFQMDRLPELQKAPGNDDFYNQ